MLNKKKTLCDTLFIKKEQKTETNIYLGIYMYMIKLRKNKGILSTLGKWLPLGWLVEDRVGKEHGTKCKLIVRF